MFDLLCSENISATEYPVVKASTIDAEQMVKEILVPSAVGTRVPQKNQKSEFWYATNPSGFQRLDEPPKKISAL